MDDDAILNRLDVFLTNKTFAIENPHRSPILYILKVSMFFGLLDEIILMAGSRRMWSRKTVQRYCVGESLGSGRERLGP